MKKLLLLFSLVTASLVTFAQLPTLGIRGGVQFAKMLIGAEGTNVTITTGTLSTYSIGAFADFKLGSVSFQPGLNYTGRGGDFTGGGGTAQFDLHYFEVPLNLVYHVPAVVGNVYFGAGPYIAFGASGTVTANDGSGEQKANVVFGGTNGDFNSTDAGINIIAGIQFKSGFLIHLNYDYGMMNILDNSNPDNTGGGKFNTRTWGLSIGYAFR